MPQRARAAASVGGITVTHPARVVYPRKNISKLDVVRYYDAVSTRMLPHLKGRPLTLVWCPAGLGGGCRFLRHSKVWGPGVIRRVRIREKTKVGEYLIADSRDALLSLAQLNVIELHTWNSNVDEDVEKPNRIVFDLDPGELVTWPQVIAAAKLLGGMLAALELKSWVKTTGGRGLHVVVPVQPERDWSECLEFARNAAALMAAQDTGRYTTGFRKAGRERKVLIDYLRNNRTNTSIAAFSLRARDQAPVSVPLAWSDLTAANTPDRFTMTSVLRRTRADPWRGYWTNRQRLTRAAMRAVSATR